MIIVDSGNLHQFGNQENRSATDWNIVGGNHKNHYCICIGLQPLARCFVLRVNLSTMMGESLHVPPGFSRKQVVVTSPLGPGCPSSAWRINEATGVTTWIHRDLEISWGSWMTMVSSSKHLIQVTQLTELFGLNSVCIVLICINPRY